jgi:hypothetical protein
VDCEHGMGVRISSTVHLSLILEVKEVVNVGALFYAGESS